MWQYAQDLGKVSAEEESEWHLVSPINHLTLESPVSSRSLSLFIDNSVIMIPTSELFFFKTHDNLIRLVCELQEDEGPHLSFYLRDKQISHAEDVPQTFAPLNLKLLSLLQSTNSS